MAPREKAAECIGVVVGCGGIAAAAGGGGDSGPEVEGLTAGPEDR